MKTLIRQCILTWTRACEKRFNLARAIDKLAAPWENVSSRKCGQRRPRSACAFAQSDQGLRCPLTESLDTIECFDGEQMPGWDFAHVRDDTLECFDGEQMPGWDFAHVRDDTIECDGAARMRLCACAGWCKSEHFAHARRHYFAWCSPIFSVSVISMQNGHGLNACYIISEKNMFLTYLSESRFLPGAFT